MPIFQNRTLLKALFKNYRKSAGPRRFSIFTACRNRNNNLVRALRSWLAHDEVGEVVIVDWSSETPVAESVAGLLPDGRIKLIRVDGETHWVNTLAFNLAAKHTSNQYLLRVDADVLLKKNFFKIHQFYDTEYMTGNPEDDKGLTGLLYVPRDHFLAVNGYNEFLRCYGWEDYDIFVRLELERNLRHRFFAFNTAYHIPHSDEERIRRYSQAHLTYCPGDLLQDATALLEKSISSRIGLTHEDRLRHLEYLLYNNNSPVDELTKITSQPVFHSMKNRYLANVMPWSSQHQQAHYQQQPGGNDKILVLKRMGDIEPIPEEIMKKAELYSFAKLFSWRHSNFMCPIKEFGLDALTDDEALTG